MGSRRTIDTDFLVQAAARLQFLPEGLLQTSVGFMWSIPRKSQRYSTGLDGVMTQTVNAVWGNSRCLL
jgi:hypothetical protein